MQSTLSRRQFLEFIGLSGVALSSGCGTGGHSEGALGLAPNTADKLTLADGVTYYVIAEAGDKINQSRDSFGVNNDFLGFLADAKDPYRGFLIVNHEFPDAIFSSGGRSAADKTKADIDRERASVGCSLLRVARESKSGRWVFDKNAKENWRLTGTSSIPFVKNQAVAGSTKAIGTFANCSGGVTPWRTFLTCEENFDEYYGMSTTDQESGKAKSKYGWLKYYKQPPEHYGWVVEIDPVTKVTKKLTGLGRFAHEGALVVNSQSGRPVVYMGDDNEGECLYKFVASRPGSLDEGTLYVANLRDSKWEVLDVAKNPILKNKFKTQINMLINTREAAKLVGGTALDRPEGIARNPITGQIVVSLTNNLDVTPPNHFGSLLSITEDNNDPLALGFKHGTFLAGGDKSGFACPDNLAFSQNGNLWITTDMSGKYMHQGPYKPFGNNSLFCVPSTGPTAGKALRIATAPTDSEFTGPCLMPDGETLLVSVQHPGEMSKSMDALTSHWPAGGNNIPRSVVIALTGPRIRSLIAESFKPA